MHENAERVMRSPAAVAGRGHATPDADTPAAADADAVDDRPVDDGPVEDGSVEPGVWRYVMARRAAMVIDAADYYRLMQQAMQGARHRILLIGWDFDTRIHLAEGRRWFQKGRDDRPPVRLGSFIPWLVRHNQRLDVRLLKWGGGAFSFMGRGPMVFDVARWYAHRRISFKFDNAHPLGCSHHQKIVVIDRQFAVCGGIDMATHRWDTREHKANDPRRRTAMGRYYGPWHDATMMLEGEAAEALDDLARARWHRAGGEPLHPLPPSDRTSAWPDKLAAQFENVEIGIARTRAAYADVTQCSEIEELFVRQIARARRFVYAESQYFASRRVAEAIAERLQEDDPPEFVIVHPRSADGWLEAQAMDNARAVLLREMRAADRHGRFHLYVPYTDEEPIYVHAKVTIVDDEILRIGSANLNNRSMGLDSECDVFIDCARAANGHCGAGIAALRRSLLAEHLGLDDDAVPGEIERHGSMAAMIAARPRHGRHLRRFSPIEPNDLQEMLARNEVLDPERPDEMFVPIAKRRGLIRRGGARLRARWTARKGRT